MINKTSESGLEAIIINHLTSQNGYEQGTSTNYNKEHAIEETRLFRFLETTQPKAMGAARR